MLKPVLEKIVKSKEYKDKFVLAKMNVEENTAVPEEYNIMSIPAVKLFKNSEIIAEFIGAKSEELVKEFLDKNL
jgi:thioredoxin-like negative regulator of GroEL